MKNIILVSFLLLSLKSKAQTDTSNLFNVSLSARILEYSCSALLIDRSDENLSTFIKWRSSYKKNPPSTNGSITTDTIPVSTMVYLYGYVLSQPEGYSVSSSFKSSIATYRAANANLDRQCSDLEVMYSSNFLGLRKIGRRLLTGQ